VTVRAVYSTGYTGSEGSVVMHGRLSPGGTPVIICHGLLVNGVNAAASALEGAIGRQLADVYEVTSGTADLGGLSTWGNDASIAALDALVTYMGSTYGTKTARVALAGISMGGCLALNWALRNPTKVASLGLVAPVVSLLGIHDRNPNGAAAAIETAYTNQAGYLAALPTHDPSHATSILTLRQLGAVTRCWYSTDDTVVVPSEVLAYSGLTGCAVDNMGAIGHNATVGALNAVAQWLDSFCS
jgi:pimeloyl-ACP methyl ester carboxylesterase